MKKSSSILTFMADSDDQKSKLIHISGTYYKPSST